MRNERNTTVLSRQPPQDFFGRTAEIEALIEFACAADDRGCVRISHGPGSGVSELLRQTYDRLFHDRGTRIPIYFSVRRSDLTAERCARRLIYQFLVQAASYKLRQPRIIAYSPTLEEIRGLVPAPDREWMGRLVEFLQNSESKSDEEMVVGSTFGAMLRAVNASPAIFFIDDLNEAQFLDDGDSLISALDAAAETAGVSLVIAELRRSHLGNYSSAHIQMPELSHSAAVRMIEANSRSLGIELKQPATDLIAIQLDCRPARIETLLRAAGEAKRSLMSFRDVETVYIDEVIGGRMARYFQNILHDAAPEPAAQKRIIETLHDLYDSQSEGFTLEALNQRTDLGDSAPIALSILHINEFLNISAGGVSGTQDRALVDHIDVRYRLEIAGGKRALVVGDTLTESLKRAPELLAKLYRRNSSAGLRELLASFDSRQVPAVLFDHSLFKSEFGGQSDAEILASLANGPDMLRLPHVVHSVNTESLYKPIAQLIERERSAVGLGFDANNYVNDEEVAWIAVELDSKMEATAELAEFWCDRLDAVALACGFSRHKIWLVAADGFSDDAMDMLRSRGSYASSRKQLDLLREYMQLKPAAAVRQHAEEYEIVVPMGENTELIAAHAVEEIAKRHDFDSKTVNQIKTALVEACINASEHGHSPDGKIYQHFRFDQNKISMTVSNRGLRLTDRKPAAKPTDRRRGWGLALMKKLMDEVVIEDVEDGTSISMVKYCAPSS